MDRASWLTTVIAWVFLVSSSFPQHFHLGSNGTLSILQISREGKIFISNGSQVIRLDSNFVVEQSLRSSAVDIFLSPVGEKLVLCTDDLTCTVYNANDQSAEPLVTINVSIVGDVNTAVFFIALDSFYVGSINYSTGVMRLSQYGLNEGNHFLRSADYAVAKESSNFEPPFISGFKSGDNVYFLLPIYYNDTYTTLLYLTVYHETECPDMASECDMKGLSELHCLNMHGRVLDSSLSIQDFADQPGKGFLMFVCSMMCSIFEIYYTSLLSIQREIDLRYEPCKNGSMFSPTSFGDSIDCLSTIVSEECQWTQPICRFELHSSNHHKLFKASQKDGVQINAYVAIKLDSVSMIIVGYHTVNDEFKIGKVSKIFVPIELVQRS